MLRILLIGEYSGVHTDLATALKKRGHYVITAHSGDGFKNFKRDFDLNITGKNKIIKLYQVALKYFRFYRLVKKSNFDIIQFINPRVFHPYIDNFLFSLIFKKNAKFVLLACGGDTMVWKAYKDGLYNYYPYDGLSEDDIKREKSFYESPRVINFSNRVYEKVDKIVPLAVEYLLAYKNQTYKIHFIPLSIDCNCIEDETNYKIGNKIKIYHPVNKGRETEKGSDIILKVLKRIEEEYGNIVEIISTQSVSFTEYKKNLNDVNIVIDQTYCYSPSMNALYSMSLGKVVLGGGEKEYLKQLNITSAPIINITPNSEDIYNKLTQLIKDNSQIEKIGKESFNFVRQYHSIENNVIKFEKVWEELLK